MGEEILRVVAALAVLAAAALCTISWRYWSHPLIKPGMLYTAAVMWAAVIYRTWVIFQPTPPNILVHILEDSLMIAIGAGFSLHALATREYHRNFRLTRGSNWKPQ